MKFETKYDIGQTVWHVIRKSRYIDVCECPVCKGTGKSILDRELYCSASIAKGYRCQRGRIVTIRVEPVPVQDCITGIVAEIYMEQESDVETKAIYHLENFEVPMYEYELFTTEAEAQARCNGLNGKES